MKIKMEVSEIVSRMNNCLNELADATGVQRCALIYAMAQLIGVLDKTYKQNMNPEPKKEE